MPEDDEDEDGLGPEPLDLSPDEDEAASSSNGPEARRVAVLLELISAGAGLNAKIAQFRDEIDLDMLKASGRVLPFNVLGGEILVECQISPE